MALTSRTVWLAAVVLLLGVAGQWLGAPFTGAWRYFAAALLLALWIEREGARRLPLQLSWQLPPALFLGVPAQIGLQLQSSAQRRLALQLALSPPAGFAGVARAQTVRLLPQQPLPLALEWVPERLGALQAAPVSARLLGRFGLGWWPRQLAAPPPQAVQPDRLHAGQRLAAGAAEGQAQALRRGHGLELLGLRDYRPGDPLRVVDARASRRRGRLIVRDTVEDQHLEVVLVIDAGRVGAVRAGRLARLHHYVNVACRFGERAASLGDRLGLVVLQGGVHRSMGALQGDAGLRRLRAALADLQPQQRESSAVAAALEVRRLSRLRALVVWLGDVEDGGSDALVQAARLLAPKHLPLFAQLLDEDVQAESRRSASVELDVYRSLAAQQLLDGQARAAQRLRRAGCEVVSARAPDLEAALVARYVSLRARRRV